MTGGWVVVEATPTGNVEVARHFQQCDALLDAATRQMECDQPGTYFHAEPADRTAKHARSNA